MPPQKRPEGQDPDLVTALQTERDDLARQMAELREQLAAQPVSSEDKFTRAMELLAERITAPAPPKEKSLEGNAPYLMSEANGAIKPIPDSEDGKLPYPKVFASRGRGCRIIYKPRRAMADSEGNSWISEGHAIDFAPNGEFRTDNPDVVRYIMARDAFNREYWDVEDPPGSVEAPDAALERLAGLLIDLNLEAINEMEVKERASLNRDIVMRQIKVAQRQVELALAKRQAEPVA